LTYANINECLSIAPEFLTSEAILQMDEEYYTNQDIKNVFTQIIDN